MPSEVGDPRPLVVVLTAYKLKIVIFPFHDGSQRLVNAVELQEFKLWKGRRMLDVGVLNLLLSLMRDESFLRRYDIEADKAQIPQGARIPKNRVCNIVTDQAKFEEISKQNSALNRMVRQQAEERKELSKQLMKLEDKEKELRKQLEDKEKELSKQLEDKEKELSKQLTKLEDMEKELSKQLEDKEKELSKQLTKLEDMEKELSKQLTKLEDKEKELSKQLTKQEDKEKELSKQLEDMEKELSKQLTKLEDKEKELSGRQGERTEQAADEAGRQGERTEQAAGRHGEGTE